jgi:hypothetical protein
VSSQSPYLTNSYPGPERPKMFRSTGGKVVWVLVPVLSFGILAALPFVVAAVKGVVRPWLACVYGASQVAFMVVATIEGSDSQNWGGMLGVVLMAASATHTALLDNERITIGK